MPRKSYGSPLLEVELLDNRVLLATVPLQVTITNVVTNGVGAVANVSTANGSLDAINATAQVSANIAALADLSSPLGANLAITTGLTAMSTASMVLTNDLVQGTDASKIIGDVLSIAGDADLVVGAIVTNLPGGAAAGRIVTELGVGINWAENVIELAQPVRITIDKVANAISNFSSPSSIYLSSMILPR